MLLKWANALTDAAAEIKKRITEEVIREIVSFIPEEWLVEESMPLTTHAMRDAYIQFLIGKIKMIDVLVKEAANAR